MRLQHLTASAHPSGNRIDLGWENPAPTAFPGVRVMRREGTYPTAPDDGELVAEGIGLQSVVDSSLRGETVYYYSLFPYTGSPPAYTVDDLNRVTAMATAPYGSAAQMYDLLPRIYHRYDTGVPSAIPPQMEPADTERGQLRRFLDLPGGQLDQIQSLARAMLDLTNPDKVDGRLLPLLAQWIGWQTDYRLETAAQRSEITYAPSLYQTIGLIPTLEATVKRVIGWESRAKEFVHNVLRTNAPERLNLWQLQRDTSGVWSKSADLLSLNSAYEGRASVARDSSGVLWLVYHTLKQERWEIWYKTYQADRGWSASQPLASDGQLNKYPTVALQGTTVWVFWSAYDEQTQHWTIRYRTRSGTDWSPTQAFADAAADRRQPWAVADATGGLWLFWIERVDGRWLLKYNRHNGTTWQLATPASFPLAGTDEPRVESDLFVLFHPTNATQRLWVFWARQDPPGVADQKHWQIAYRVKQGLDPAVTTDWSAIRTLPAVASNDDREPAVMVNAGGNIELFWSSTRSGSWSIWRATLVDAAAGTWGAAEEVVDSRYSQRTPLPIIDNGRTSLIFRSNESRSYASQVYGATETTDFRYAGSTTLDSRNLAKIALRGQFEDFQTYTYDAGAGGNRDDTNWYARDTIGLYLTPTTEDPQLILRNQDLVKSVLRQFLPIQVRTIFIIEPVVYKELIYTYDSPTASPQRVIDEQFFDSRIAEIYSGLREQTADSIPGWVWMRSWRPGSTPPRTVDVTATPINANARTWQPGIDVGG